MTTIRLGVLGCGNVGAALVRLVGEQADAIEARSGVRLEVAKVAVRNLSAQRAVALPEGVLTRDAAAVVADPNIDMVIELIGGIEPARELITTALRNGKPVVTGNKELLANVGAELFARWVMPQFQGSLDSIIASRDWARKNRKDIFVPSIAAVKQAYTDAGREAPEDYKARLLGTMDEKK